MSPEPYTLEWAEEDPGQYWICSSCRSINHVDDDRCDLVRPDDTPCDTKQFPKDVISI